ncbi:hypothetical protein FF38_06144 [Lucilia cuprina]|uniref:Uncharacterized protein n=1 Tax=Lucilia cuprina TaxID=7375 RepID=A0A0L0C695_LUCCU|nr:hypothetical protein CVS40_0444 [Lucilia cuprina]KNC27903.1 hypothetical protein FF38_06144 [Lucilia cuprina]
MTDPWSVQGTKEVIRQDNSTNKSKESTPSESPDKRNDSQTLGFEDSFIQEKDTNSNTFEAPSAEDSSKEVVGSQHQPLPDSETYLQSLERKLEKLKKGSKLVDALAEKREDCLRSMLQNNSSQGLNNDILLELEASITNTDSAVQNLYRQLQPVQPVTVGETVHIVKYDQLEEQRLEQEAAEELDENLPASR